MFSKNRFARVRNIPNSKFSKIVLGNLVYPGTDDTFIVLLILVLVIYLLDAGPDSGAS
jgi:hypothetical protein